MKKSLLPFIFILTLAGCSAQPANTFSVDFPSMLKENTFQDDTSPYFHHELTCTNLDSGYLYCYTLNQATQDFHNVCFAISPDGKDEVYLFGSGNNYTLSKDMTDKENYIYQGAVIKFKRDEKLTNNVYGCFFSQEKELHYTISIGE